MRRTSLKIIQFYSPTSVYDDKRIEIFYEDISKTKEVHTNWLTIIIGDLSVKLGKKLNNRDESRGTCLSPEKWKTFYPNELFGKNYLYII